MTIEIFDFVKVRYIIWYDSKTIMERAENPKNHSI